jgi:hypothetical protein
MAGGNIFQCDGLKPPHDLRYSQLGHTHAGGGGLGYALALMALVLSTLTDAATYYFGGVGIAPGTVADVARVYVPKAGTIKAAFVFWRAVTAGTSEAISVYLRKNNATDYLIATIGDGAAVKVFSNVGLSIAMAQGDYFEIKIVCPTWVTNPATVRLGGNVYLE